jgi:hypothetical protein
MTAAELTALNVLYETWTNRCVEYRQLLDEAETQRMKVFREIERGMKKPTPSAPHA